MILCLRVILRCALFLTVSVLGYSVSADEIKEPSKEIVIWHSFPNDSKEILNHVIDDYNRSQSRVHVRSLMVPYEAFEDKINTLAKLGQGPDLFIYLHDKAWRFVMHKPILENIDFYIEERDPQSLQRFVPNTVNALYFNQQLMGLPLSFYTLALVSNPQLIAKVPETMPEILQFAREFKTAHANEQGEGFAYEYTNYYFHAALLHAFGGRILDQNHLPLLDSSPSLKALTTLKNWLTERDLAYTWTSPEYQGARFKDGRLAMYLTGPWIINELSGKVDFKVEPMPYIDAQKQYRMQPYMNVEAVFLTNFSKHKAESYYFMQYLTSDAVAMQFNAVPDRLIANSIAYTSEEAQTSIKYGFYQQALTSVPIAFAPEMHPVWEAMQNVLFQISSANAQPATVLADEQHKLLETIQRFQQYKPEK